MSEIGNNLGFFHLGCTLWAWRFSTVHGNIAVFPATTVTSKTGTSKLGSKAKTSKK
jgi:hypothetical protein